MKLIIYKQKKHRNKAEKICSYKLRDTLFKHGMLEYNIYITIINIKFEWISTLRRFIMAYNK